jgi:hypothetical protein
MQSAFEAVGVHGEQSIDKTEELHYPLVLAEILVTYRQIILGAVQKGQYADLLAHTDNLCHHCPLTRGDEGVVLTQ